MIEKNRFCLKNRDGFFLSVEEPYAEIEICRKAQPYHIGNLNESCQFIDPVEEYCHDKDCQQKQQKPYEREKIQSESEKQYAPPEIQSQLDGIDKQGLGRGLVIGVIYNGGTDGHE